MVSPMLKLKQKIISVNSSNSMDKTIQTVAYAFSPEDGGNENLTFFILHFLGN